MRTMFVNQWLAPAPIRARHRARPDAPATARHEVDRADRPDTMVEALPLGWHEVSFIADDGLDPLTPWLPDSPTASALPRRGLRSWSPKSEHLQQRIYRRTRSNRAPVRAMGSPTALSWRQRAWRGRMRLSAGVAALAFGALAVNTLPGLMSVQSAPPRVQLTAAQASMADATPVRADVIPVLNIGRVGAQTPGSESTMTPETFALLLAALTRAGYATVTPTEALGEGTGGRVVVAVHADPQTVAAVESVLAPRAGRAVAVIDAATESDVSADEAGNPMALGLAPGAAPRWSVAAALPADTPATGPTLVAAQVEADTTPEQLLTALGQLNSTAATPDGAAGRTAGGTAGGTESAVTNVADDVTEDVTSGAVLSQY